MVERRGLNTTQAVSRRFKDFVIETLRSPNGLSSALGNNLRSVLFGADECSTDP
jgi:hypothetical protein